MKAILANTCTSLTGSLGREYGYHLQRRKDGIFAVRQSKGYVPSFGHLQFIFACANLSKYRLHLTDIEVSAKEFRKAIEEAGEMYGVDLKRLPAKQILNSRLVLEFKLRYNL